MDKPGIPHTHMHTHMYTKQASSTMAEQELEQASFTTSKSLVYNSRAAMTFYNQAGGGVKSVNLSTK